MRGLKKIACEGDIDNKQTDGRTLQLLDQLGPEGRVGENILSVLGHTKKSKVNMKQEGIITIIIQPAGRYLSAGL